MPENMMNIAHKASTVKYRDGYDRTFGTDHKYPDEHRIETINRVLRKYESEKRQRTEEDGS